MGLRDDVGKILISEQQVQARVAELAQEINATYTDDDCPLLVCVLKGAFIFLADLVRHLEMRHEVDFMEISSYGKGTVSTGVVRILLDLRADIYQKHVLIIEDIVDTGNTIDYLYTVLKTRKPASIQTCVLTRKTGKALETKIDYLGFEIPDVWVVGYGLDFAERHRTWPFIAELKQDHYNNE